MGYRSLADCVADLERQGHLIRIKEEVDPYLEMAAIHLRVYEKQGPALLFERVKGSRFPAVSNLFGTLDRSRFLFRDTLDKMKLMVKLKMDPASALKNPFQYAGITLNALSALPLKRNPSALKVFNQTTIGQLPQIINWPDDGGAFVTMPQVYSEDVDKPGIGQSNIGMYRIQLSGNDYIADQEIGLHYQLHRGIGVHQAKANASGKPLKVSIFIGGPPSHPLSAVMPLPEGLSESIFAGALNNRRYRYTYDEEGFCISLDADFVITGTVYPGENKPEGPFGDHLGYYSLVHDFPLMKVHRVYHKPNAIWSFTVVGRPPQEDTSFGALIHEVTGPAIPNEVHGLKAVHAVDAAGVHPLLFAIGSERYTPYSPVKQPQEILTIANQILGKNQLSLAKYLFIAAHEDRPDLDIHNIESFFKHMLERVDLSRDLHFQTRTTIDTLDYSGDGLNSGSKLVVAAVGPPRRELGTSLPAGWKLPAHYGDTFVALPGVLTVSAPAFSTYEEERARLAFFVEELNAAELAGFPLLVLCDDGAFTAASISNFVWVTFTRSNPSHDTHGTGSFTEDKHWGCRETLIIDARVKPHHAPILEMPVEIERQVDELGTKGKSLYGWL